MKKKLKSVGLNNKNNMASEKILKELADIKESIPAHISAETRKLASLLDTHSAAQSEIMAKLTLLHETLSGLVAVQQVKAVKKKVEAVPEGSDPNVPATAPAAAPKGKKVTSEHNAWFKTKYTAEEDFRAKCGADPVIAELLASIKPEVDKKKTPATKITCELTQITKNCVEIVKRLYDAEHTNLLVPV